MLESQKTCIGLNLLATIVAGLLIWITTPNAVAKQKLFEVHMPVVAIDPGHGGPDTGAQGPNNIAEKTVTLNLARIIAQQLAAEYRVLLTRNDDYGLDNSSRTAAANHADADIFVSLHTGSSFIHDINRSSVYFYMPFQGSALRTEPHSPRSPTDNEPADRWDMIQMKYRSASEKLAIQVRSRLAEIWQPHNVTVQGIPLLVLEGADMPAVVIEIGNLANASAEKELADDRFLVRIAKVIATAIADFLAENSR